MAANRETKVEQRMSVGIVERRQLGRHDAMPVFDLTGLGKLRGDVSVFSRLARFPQPRKIKIWLGWRCDLSCECENPFLQYGRSTSGSHPFGRGRFMLIRLASLSFTSTRRIWELFTKPKDQNKSPMRGVAV